VSDQRDNHGGQRRRYRIAGSANHAAPLAGPTPHVDDLAAPYALGALETDEFALVDAHIRGCPACEHAVREATRTAGMLPFLIPPQTPSLDTKVALFARVAHAQKAAALSPLPMPDLDAFRTPTLPKSDAAAPGAPLAPAPAATAAAPVPAARGGWLATAFSLPLLVALIATGMWGMQLRDQLALNRAQLAESQAELTNFGSGTTSYPLQPGGAAPQAEGSIVMGADGQGGMLKIDVNSDEGPRAFELWANENGELVRVADVTVDPSGQGQTRFKLDRPFSEYESVHIKAKALDPGASGAQFDTLIRDNNGSLGSTGSGLDLVP
jgi:hypothetical protein